MRNRELGIGQNESLSERGSRVCKHSSLFWRRKKGKNIKLPQAVAIMTRRGVRAALQQELELYLASGGEACRPTLI